MAIQLIGTRVRLLRRSLKIKQSDLAQSVGISASYLNLIEHNKRPVAGKLLLSLAAELHVTAEHLAQNADTNMLERFHQTARRMPSISAELERIDEFIGRFPGWAELLDDQIQKTEAQADTLASLSDQFHHDPVLRDTLHIMLTNITAIRSTAEILVLHGALESEQRARFDANIFQESKRLARKAEELLAAFDPDITLDNSATSSRKSALRHEGSKEKTQSIGLAETIHTMHPVGRYVAALEEDIVSVSDIVAQSEFTKFSETPAASKHLQSWAQRYRDVALALPISKLIETAEQHLFDPFLIAEMFQLDVQTVFFRLAHLPTDTAELPQFGLLEIDNSAGVLLRKELRALRLPNRSGACPRWPIYRALSRPQQGLVARLNPIDGMPCMSYSYAWQTKYHLTGLPPIMRAMMLYREAGSPADKIGSRAQTAATQLEIDVGFHCAICARTSCEDRREAYALTS